MKKMIVFCVVIAVAILLIGCEENPDQDLEDAYGGDALAGQALAIGKTKCRTFPTDTCEFDGTTYKAVDIDADKTFTKKDKCRVRTGVEFDWTCNDDGTLERCRTACEGECGAVACVPIDPDVLTVDSEVLIVDPIAATTGVCSSTSLEYCIDQITCESAGLSWYGDACHTEPEPIAITDSEFTRTCSVDYLELCESKEECESAGFFWDGDACVEPMAAPASVPAGADFCGDIDSDGLVNFVDVELMMEYITTASGFSAEEIRRADVNGDGVVDVVDTVLVENHIIMETPLSCMPLVEECVPTSATIIESCVGETYLNVTDTGCVSEVNQEIDCTTLGEYTCATLETPYFLASPAWCQPCGTSICQRTDNGWEYFYDGVCEEDPIRSSIAIGTVEGPNCS
jgi:hypothetical protein